MRQPTASPFLVSTDGTFDLSQAATRPPKGAPGRKTCEKRLGQRVEELADLQRILYAHDRHAILLIFQALDAAGKDSTIRAVPTGVNPAGFQVFSFKRPTPEELDHDFLWRTSRALPERGRIGVFNRSYYEEVLVVRVHPEYLDAQQLPDRPGKARLWRERYQSIREHERHLARNGTVIVKFWLNVSRDEQRRRFLDRIDEPHKNWKFSEGDLRERRFWDQYLEAYAQALRETSRPWAPWYAIPADDKPFMRLTVAEIIVSTLKSLDLRYPSVGPRERARFAALRAQLEEEEP